jgi:hypothetical protein
MRIAPALPTTLLRDLTVDATAHARGGSPDAAARGRVHLSAASGLVCQHGRAYVVADDEHHLAVFCDVVTPGALHRIRAGDLPPHKRARKRRKPDLEALVALPARAGGVLLALGSGSRANRCTGFAIALDRSGAPLAAVNAFDLTPLYRPLIDRFGGLNIEGAMVLGDELVLLNRGGRDGLPNAALLLPLAALLGAMSGSSSGDVAARVQHFHLGALDGVALGFTDAAARPDGSWLFSAAAEHSADSVADGPCRGSVVGEVSARGELVAMRRIAGTVKVEGVAVQPGGTSICMVTDADDPRCCAQLLQATWPRARD